MVNNRRSRCRLSDGKLVKNPSQNRFHIRRDDTGYDGWSTPPPQVFLSASMVTTPVIIDHDPKRVHRLYSILEKLFHLGVGGNTLELACDIWWAVLDRFHGGEKPYMDAIHGLSRESLDYIAQGFAELITHFCEEGRFSDILGPVYMKIRSNWGGKLLGQYFTPWSIAVAMASMTMGDIKTKLEAQDEVSVMDPCVGSGVMLLAARAIVAQQYGRKALRKIRVFGQDIDALCVKMAKIQCRLSDDWYMTNYLLAFYGEFDGHEKHDHVVKSMC